MRRYPFEVGCGVMVLEGGESWPCDGDGTTGVGQHKASVVCSLFFHLLAFAKP